MSEAFKKPSEVFKAGILSYSLIMFTFIRKFWSNNRRGWQSSGKGYKITMSAAAKWRFNMPLLTQGRHTCFWKLIERKNQIKGWTLKLTIYSSKDNNDITKSIRPWAVLNSDGVATGSRRESHSVSSEIPACNILKVSK